MCKVSCLPCTQYDKQPYHHVLHVQQPAYSTATTTATHHCMFSSETHESNDTNGNHQRCNTHNGGYDDVARIIRIVPFHFEASENSNSDVYASAKSAFNSTLISLITSLLNSSPK